jgi:hypothetical protein
VFELPGGTPPQTHYRTALMSTKPEPERFPPDRSNFSTLSTVTVLNQE